MRHVRTIFPASLLLVFCAFFTVTSLAIADPLEPYKVAVSPEGNIYALIAGNNSMSYHIFEFTPDGKIVRTIESRTSDIAIDAAGNLYYFGDLDICSVTRLDPDGNTALAWYNDSNNSIAPGAIAVSPGGDLYVSIFDLRQATGNIDRCHVYAVSVNGSSWPGYSENVTSKGGGFSTMAVDASGTIYGAGNGNRIAIISPNGTVTTIGNLGADNGKFNMVSAVAIGSDGYLYVAEHGNRRIQKLTTDGTFVSRWDGCGPDRFYGPSSIAVDSTGRVYVADHYNQRIVWFTPDYVFGENATENLKGQGTTWGNVIAGANYTTVMKQIEDEKAVAASTPGFAAFTALIGIGMGVVLYCLRK